MLVEGAISPSVSGATVTLTYESPKGSFNSTVTTGATGHYSDVLTPLEAGLWRVHASWPGNATHTGATSASVHFTVQDTPGFQIPGFPFEAIIIGLVLGIGVFVLRKGGSGVVPSPA
jgi:hypothetical protein